MLVSDGAAPYPRYYWSRLNRMTYVIAFVGAQPYFNTTHGWAMSGFGAEDELQFSMERIYPSATWRQEKGLPVDACK